MNKTTPLCKYVLVLAVLICAGCGGSGSGSTSTGNTGATGGTGSVGNTGSAASPASAGTAGSTAGSTGSSTVNPTAYKLSGSVTAAGTGMPGATVTLSGLGAATAFTNSSGNYSFSGLAQGNYKVTVTKPNFSCLPKAGNYSITGADISGANFTATPSSTLFYVIDDFNQLAAVDIAKKSVVIIGNTRQWLNDIAFDPSGNLYGVSGDQLFKIDPATAVTTPLAAPLGVNDTTSLVFKDDGTLYTANTSLCVVNPITGIAAVIGSGGDQYKSSGDLAFLGDQLYLTSTLNGTEDSLTKLNLSGAGTTVGPIGFVNVYGLATNDDVTLYGFSGNKVIVINTTTGAGSLFWDFGGMTGLGPINGATFSALAPVPPTSPLQ